MRKVQDYYFKKAKKDHYPARSVYKLEEVQAKYRFIQRGDSVLDLGCYPGSWSLFAAETVGPKGVVVGVDLQQADEPARPDSSPIHWLCQDIMAPELIPAGPPDQAGLQGADLGSGAENHRQPLG